MDNLAIPLFFTSMALDVWNRLPNHVVLSDTVNTFNAMQCNDDYGRRREPVSK